MVYCKGEEVPCDNTRENQRSVYSESSFSSWFEDDDFYNIRSAFKQRLDFYSAKKYRFDVKNAAQDPQSPLYYSPITDKGLSGWPLSPKEQQDSVVAGPGVRKYWFTTEFHTSFVYTGTETINFYGNDDVHIFINNRIALNFGGFHVWLLQTFTLSEFSAELGLVVGKVYSLDFFQVHRRVSKKIALFPKS